jgi:DNA invertase Pin-like site-specific DNA recombinase
MPVYGRISKGERNRIKIRVKAAMGAQAKDEGRLLGGARPTGTCSQMRGRIRTRPRPPTARTPNLSFRTFTLAQLA